MAAGPPRHRHQPTPLAQQVKSHVRRTRLVPGQQLSVCHDTDAAVGVAVGIVYDGEHPFFEDHPVCGARALACPGGVAGQRPQPSDHVRDLPGDTDPQPVAGVTGCCPGSCCPTGSGCWAPNLLEPDALGGVWPQERHRTSRAHARSRSRRRVRRCRWRLSSARRSRNSSHSSSLGPGIPRPGRRARRRPGRPGWPGWPRRGKRPCSPDVMIWALVRWRCFHASAASLLRCRLSIPE